MKRFSLALTLAPLLLSACGPSIDVNNPEYQIGYNEGCDAGTSYDPQYSKRVRRNENMWSASEFYRSGWKAGFSHCRPPASQGGGFEIPGSDRR